MNNDDRNSELVLNYLSYLRVILDFSVNQTTVQRANSIKNKMVRSVKLYSDICNATCTRNFARR